VRTLASLALLLALTGCQWGPPPRIPYVDGTTYVTPDGARQPLTGQEKRGVSGIAPLDGGHLVADTFWFEGTVGLSALVDGERTELGPCASGAGVLSRDRREVAWLTMGCPESNQTGPTIVHVGHTVGAGGWSRSLGYQYLMSAVGFVGEQVVITSRTGHVLLVARSGPFVAVPHLRHAVDAHGRLVAGRQGVVDTVTGRLLWHDPHTSLVSFSPDGHLLVGYRHRALVLLDAGTGRKLSTLPHRLEGLTWEDGAHLLAVAYGGDSQAMVRVGLDGRAELVGPVVDGSAGYRYSFEAQP
jgi:hypothetical protein